MKRNFIFTFLILITLISAIDIDNLLNYENQSIPNYITKDNTAGNAITNEGATLGRVLFYDKNLSVNNTIACASCHKQEFAFGDDNQQSIGMAGNTGRHSMRLANARFGTDVRFFWDERAATLEQQTTQPIQDHIEMGFSGNNGDPGINDLITKLSAIGYYDTLFTLAYGTSNITEARMQDALAQFVRSIQSFDSKFDVGLAANNNVLNTPFANFTAEENAGKQLFLAPPNAGGAGCQGCHRAPEFDIAPNSLNNNIIGNLSTPGTPDITVFRSPSLRNSVRANGASNGAFMHDGSKATLLDVVNHYNLITWNSAINPNLDNRLKGPTNTGQNLNLTTAQKNNLVAFLQTLTGNAVYTDVRWANPFNTDGSLSLASSALVPSVIVDGHLRLNKVDTLNTNDYTVVRKSDGTLAVKKSAITVSNTGDTLHIGSVWIIVPGISNANN
jgi:cytochrome c peroxidase